MGKKDKQQSKKGKKGQKQAAPVRRGPDLQGQAERTLRNILRSGDARAARRWAEEADPKVGALAILDSIAAGDGAIANEAVRAARMPREEAYSQPSDPRRAVLEILEKARQRPDPRVSTRGVAMA